MANEIINILSTVTAKSEQELKDDLTAKELWDSFGRVEIVLALEDHFNIVFSPEEIALLNTPQQVIDAITTKSR